MDYFVERSITTLSFIETEYYWQTLQMKNTSYCGQRIKGLYHVKSRRMFISRWDGTSLGMPCAVFTRGVFTPIISWENRHSFVCTRRRRKRKGSYVELFFSVCCGLLTLRAFQFRNGTYVNRARKNNERPT